ncbi:MAG: phytoene desaturase [Flavobacteriales bacterium]|nr:phytoene desaturase [Flavobacteriales bacterium]
MKNITVIGSGFSGLSAAAFLAKDGYIVTLLEKNSTVGGRARLFKEKGYSFDMGPSWYWMPEIFENFFKEFDCKIEDYYDLKKLDPGFKIVFKDVEINLSSNWKDICELFDKYEKGGATKLNNFMKDAEQKYNIGLDFLYSSPGISISELFTTKILKNLNKLEILTSYRNHIKKYFTNPYLVNILEFPVLFLGTSAKNTPALYSLMAYSGIKQGTYYPIGGFNKVIKSMEKICLDLGVKIQTNQEVKKINVRDSKVFSISTKNQEIKTDILVASADYAHVEENLLEKKYRNYSKEYWNKKSFSPSSLLFYLGVSKKIKNLDHHTLFFDEDIEKHSNDIYQNPIWPEKPLFYTCCPSKTDPTVAPKDKENLFILIPIAAGLEDSEIIREKYFKIVMDRLEKFCNLDIRKYIEYKRSYCINDFKEDYYAYKGNAYGLANTLMQTANLKPKIKSKKIKNMYYTGQLTVPGPGVPPSIISGQLVAEQIIKTK